MAHNGDNTLKPRTEQSQSLLKHLQSLLRETGVTFLRTLETASSYDVSALMAIATILLAQFGKNGHSEDAIAAAGAAPALALALGYFGFSAVLPGGQQIFGATGARAGLKERLKDISTADPTWLIVSDINEVPNETVNTYVFNITTSSITHYSEKGTASVLKLHDQEAFDRNISTSTETEITQEQQVKQALVIDLNSAIDANRETIEDLFRQTVIYGTLVAAFTLIPIMLFSEYLFAGLGMSPDATRYAADFSKTYAAALALFAIRICCEFFVIAANQQKYTAAIALTFLAPGLFFTNKFAASKGEGFSEFAGGSLAIVAASTLGVGAYTVCGPAREYNLLRSLFKIKRQDFADIRNTMIKPGAIFAGNSAAEVLFAFILSLIAAKRDVQAIQSLSTALTTFAALFFAAANQVVLARVSQIRGQAQTDATVRFTAIGSATAGGIIATLIFLAPGIAWVLTRPTDLPRLMNSEDTDATPYQITAVALLAEGGRQILQAALRGADDNAGPAVLSTIILGLGAFGAFVMAPFFGAPASTISGVAACAYVVAFTALVMRAAQKLTPSALAKKVGFQLSWVDHGGSPSPQLLLTDDDITLGSSTDPSASGSADTVHQPLLAQDSVNRHHTAIRVEMSPQGSGLRFDTPNRTAPPRPTIYTSPFKKPSVAATSAIPLHGPEKRTTIVPVPHTPEDYSSGTGFTPSAGQPAAPLVATPLATKYGSMETPPSTTAATLATSPSSEPNMPKQPPRPWLGITRSPAHASNFSPT